MSGSTSLLINIDVPELPAALAFYEAAFGLAIGRRFGDDAAELLGWAAPLYLLRNAAGSIGAGDDTRHYDRHWTPVHLDVVVPDLAAATARALAAGATAETPVRVEPWGRIVTFADPFGHGFCLIEFQGAGYDEIADT